MDYNPIALHNALACWNMHSATVPSQLGVLTTDLLSTNQCSIHMEMVVGG